MSFAENFVPCPNFGALSGLSPARANELAARPPTMRPATMPSLRLRTMSPPMVACRPAGQSPGRLPCRSTLRLARLGCCKSIDACCRGRPCVWLGVVLLSPAGSDLGVSAQRAELGEADLVVDRLFHVDARHLRDAVAEPHAGVAMALGDLSIVPERQRERRSFPREKQESFETLGRAKPPNHLLRDDRRVPRWLVRSAHTREAHVHADPPFPSDPKSSRRRV